MSKGRVAELELLIQNWTARQDRPGQNPIAKSLIELNLRRLKAALAREKNRG